MAGLKPETLSWVDQLETIRALGPNASRADRTKALNLSNALVTNIIKLESCFDPATIEKIRQAALADPPYILSSNSAKALSRLKKKVKAEDLSSLVHAALDVILAHRLTTKQINSLVKWMISGKPASEFDPNQKIVNLKDEEEDETKNEEESSESGVSTSSLDLKKLGQLLEKTEKERIRGKETVNQDKLVAHILKIAESLKPKSNKKSSSSKKDFSENIMLDWLGDIKFIKHIQAKIKKKQPLTRGEVAFLWFHKLGEIMGHLVKMTLKTFKPILKMLHWVWKLVIDILKEIGLYKYAKAVFVFAAIFVACWFVWQAVHYGVMRPMELVWSKFHRTPMVSSEPTPAPTPQPEISTVLSYANRAMNHLKPKPTPVPQSVVTYQPAVSFIPSPSSTKTLYDPKILELEMAAIPANSVIKDYVFQPDEGMPADLAVSRLQDLTDTDKYTMMIGEGKQKILSFTPSNSDFIITYQSTDPLSVFGGGPVKMNFFWEDVKYIHINEIDRIYSQSGVQQSDIKYQCTVVSKNTKDSLTLQCASADDLENLVSALEYFIRHSRLSHDAQPAGMPYPSQGLRLKNDGVVEKLWANSPIDKAGVGLGDMVWSLDKNTQEPQKPKALETALQSLTPRQHNFYVVSPEEQVKAHIEENASHSGFFNPKRRKVTLAI